ncbi:MAG: 2-dehydropantoate 2-reductase [Gammaproteobacteria bacterium]|nr:2-dehydropantoate 2-reductase [Gammaproteobacteria bacterium]
MKICVIGAGAIGGLVAAGMARSGNQVTVIDVGEHLEAIQKNGLTVVAPDGGESTVESLRAVSDYEDAGGQDLVILAVKTNVLPRVAPRLGALLGDDTVILPLQNGIPWWYFQRFDCPYENRVVESVDPGGKIAEAIDPGRILGCVVYPAGEIVRPGVIKHVEGNRFPVGELDGQTTTRAEVVAALFNDSGFKSFLLDDIRSEIWLKLWGNLSFNPISALTHATLVDICQFPLTRQLAADMMREAQAVAEHLGATFRLPLEKRIEGAEKVGKHKTSMLQDVEAGRPLEIDAIISAVVEFGRMTGIDTPAIDAVHALIRLLDQTMREDHGAVQLRRVA